MTIISTGLHPKALWPGIHEWFGRSYAEHPEEYPDLFDRETSDKAYEEDVEITGFGLAPVKTQGESVRYEAESQGFTKRYTHVAYGLGYVVTHEELQDNLYEVVSKRRAKMLAFSMRQTKENVAANVYNNGFTSGYTGGDGIILFSASHPTTNGNQSNLLSTAADLSEASIEDMAVQVMQAKNNKGLLISLMPQSLHIAPANYFEANRIVKSVQQNDTANNAINVINSVGLFPKGIKLCHYFTDTDAWFVRTNCPSGLTQFQREAMSFDQDNDFDTKNAKAKSYERYSFGWTDWRGVFGTPGA